MSAEFFNALKMILQVLIVVSFILALLYLAYCEGKKREKA